MVTSSIPQEGKSTIACCLAYNQAATGSRVLLIDADMRRPSIYKKAGLDSGEGFAALLRGTGLAGVLQGKASFEDVMVRSVHSNLFIIPAGKESNYDSEMLVSSDAMQKLLSRARKEFDMVILDTPPVMACADARILASKVDATIFVVRWGSTKLAVVKLAIEQLANAGAKFAGSFLSMVNLKNYTTYNYGDVVAYTGEMASYYAGAPETRKGRDKSSSPASLIPRPNPAD
jgi:capsular exopolysaccharide synthesis family protein